jgi:EAL domain-containing protein (putative c-di-GMP-specific phosphodiesterase class I)
MVTMAEALQWTLVAEGVESAPHCQTLRKLGCHTAQGYAIAQPMPGRELADWARSYQRSLSQESLSR